MKTYTYIYSLLVLLVLTLSLPGLVRADSGSSGGMYTAPADPDFDRAKKEIKAKNWDAAIEQLKKTLARRTAQRLHRVKSTFMPFCKKIRSCSSIARPLRIE